MLLGGLKENGEVDVLEDLVVIEFAERDEEILGAWSNMETVAQSFVSTFPSEGLKAAVSIVALRNLLEQLRILHILNLDFISKVFTGACIIRSEKTFKSCLVAGFREF